MSVHALGTMSRTFSTNPVKRFSVIRVLLAIAAPNRCCLGRLIFGLGERKAIDPRVCRMQ